MPRFKHVGPPRTVVREGRGSLLLLLLLLLTQRMVVVVVREQSTAVAVACQQRRHGPAASAHDQLPRLELDGQLRDFFLERLEQHGRRRLDRDHGARGRVLAAQRLLHLQDLERALHQRPQPLQFEVALFAQLVEPARSQSKIRTFRAYTRLNYGHVANATDDWTGDKRS